MTFDENIAAVATNPNANGTQCTYVIAKLGKPYPRTCAICGLGTCRYLPRKTRHVATFKVDVTHPEGVAAEDLRKVIKTAIEDAMLENYANITHEQALNVRVNYHGSATE